MTRAPSLKEELIWLKEWDSLAEAKATLQKWIQNYNESYLHSAHGYRSPVWAEKQYKEKPAA